MFSKFRNIFSKSKTEKEQEPETVTEIETVENAEAPTVTLPEESVRDASETVKSTEIGDVESKKLVENIVKKVSYDPTLALAEDIEKIKPGTVITLENSIVETEIVDVVELIADGEGNSETLETELNETTINTLNNESSTNETTSLTKIDESVKKCEPKTVVTVTFVKTEKIATPKSALVDVEPFDKSNKSLGADSDSTVACKTNEVSSSNTSLNVDLDSPRPTRAHLYELLREPLSYVEKLAKVNQSPILKKKSLQKPIVEVTIEEPISNTDKSFVKQDDNSETKSNLKITEDDVVSEVKKEEKEISTKVNDTTVAVSLEELQENKANDAMIPNEKESIHYTVTDLAAHIINSVLEKALQKACDQTISEVDETSETPKTEVISDETEKKGDRDLTKVIATELNEKDVGNDIDKRRKDEIEEEVIKSNNEELVQIPESEELIKDASVLTYSESDENPKSSTAYIIEEETPSAEQKETTDATRSLTPLTIERDVELVKELSAEPSEFEISASTVDKDASDQALEQSNDVEEEDFKVEFTMPIAKKNSIDPKELNSLSQAVDENETKSAEIDAEFSIPLTKKARKDDIKVIEPNENDIVVELKDQLKEIENEKPDLAPQHLEELADVDVAYTLPFAKKISANSEPLKEDILVRDEELECIAKNEKVEPFDTATEIEASENNETNSIEQSQEKATDVDIVFTLPIRRKKSGNTTELPTTLQAVNEDAENATDETDETTAQPLENQVEVVDLQPLEDAADVNTEFTFAFVKKTPAVSTGNIKDIEKVDHLSLDEISEPSMAEHLKGEHQILPSESTTDGNVGVDIKFTRPFASEHLDNFKAFYLSPKVEDEEDDIDDDDVGIEFTVPLAKKTVEDCYNISEAVPFMEHLDSKALHESDEVTDTTSKPYQLKAIDNNKKVPSEVDSINEEEQVKVDISFINNNNEMNSQRELEEIFAEDLQSKLQNVVDDMIMLETLAEKNACISEDDETCDENTTALGVTPNVTNLTIIEEIISKEFEPMESSSEKPEEACDSPIATKAIDAELTMPLKTTDLKSNPSKAKQESTESSDVLSNISEGFEHNTHLQATADSNDSISNFEKNVKYDELSATSGNTDNNAEKLKALVEVVTDEPPKSIILAEAFEQNCDSPQTTEEVEFISELDISLHVEDFSPENDEETEAENKTMHELYIDIDEDIQNVVEIIKVSNVPTSVCEADVQTDSLDNIETITKLDSPKTILQPNTDAKEGYYSTKQPFELNSIEDESQEKPDIVQDLQTTDPEAKQESTEPIGALLNNSKKPEPNIDIEENRAISKENVESTEVKTDYDEKLKALLDAVTAESSKLQDVMEEKPDYAKATEETDLPVYAEDNEVSPRDDKETEPSNQVADTQKLLDLDEISKAPKLASAAYDQSDLLDNTYTTSMLDSTNNGANTPNKVEEMEPNSFDITIVIRKPSENPEGTGESTKIFKNSVENLTATETPTPDAEMKLTASLDETISEVESGKDSTNLGSDNMVDNKQHKIPQVDFEKPSADFEEIAEAVVLKETANTGIHKHPENAETTNNSQISESDNIFESTINSLVANAVPEQSEYSENNEVVLGATDLDNSQKIEIDTIVKEINESLATSDNPNTPNPITFVHNDFPSLSDNKTENNVMQLDNNISNNSSAMSDDLNNDVTSPSTDSGNGGSELNTTAAIDTSTAAALIVTPTGNNAIACNAISNKLSEISEVAESLDSVIRDVQEDAEGLVETNSTGSSNDKKMENMHNNDSEDWHSRSTEDESFASASEGGNFTPHSHSSSFQTASGRTSSFISSDKNSFDASEADDSTFAFDIPDIPELLSVPHNHLHNISLDSSDHSFLSAQQSPSPTVAHGNRVRLIPIDIEPRSDPADVDHDDDGSVVGVEELHSQSVTPTPGDNHFESIPIESEHEWENEAAAAGGNSVSCIADAPSMEILTELTPMTLSMTPEVSNACPNASAADASLYAPNQQGVINANTNKPNAAWRRNKYYENITKQTIKGFL